ncbi:hypothetical protein BDW72DRAFT_173468 [Aspergillus terricola var. indicus]
MLCIYAVGQCILVCVLPNYILWGMCSNYTRCAQVYGVVHTTGASSLTTTYDLMLKS